MGRFHLFGVRVENLENVVGWLRGEMSIVPLFTHGLLVGLVQKKFIKCWLMCIVIKSGLNPCVSLVPSALSHLFHHIACSSSNLDCLTTLVIGLSSSPCMQTCSSWRPCSGLTHLLLTMLAAMERKTCLSPTTLVFSDCPPPKSWI